jgi:uncharacterized protein YndB with AHSA1/START domain
MPDLLHRIPINAIPKDVYDAVATQAGMQGWWSQDTKMDERVGGKTEFGFSKRSMVFRMVIDALEPGRTVRLACSGDHAEWAGTTLEWKVETAPEGSILHFSHRGWREMTPFAATCNTTWGELMYRLKSFVETRRANPHWIE